MSTLPNETQLNAFLIISQRILDLLDSWGQLGKPVPYVVCLAASYNLSAALDLIRPVE